MAHAPGWIELYNILERNEVPRSELVELCKRGRSGLGETMLHWYAIEGAPAVVERLIALGFVVNVQNEFGNTPIMEAGQLERWDMVELLLRQGADTQIRNQFDNAFSDHLAELGVTLPARIQALMA